MEKVCVIGAGLSGVISCRHFKDHYNVTVFEASDSIGGLWRFSEDTDDTTDS
jgi:cation diffusion facilitator CzcD-associated flavoprotein CzcO